MCAVEAAPPTPLLLVLPDIAAGWHGRYAVALARGVRACGLGFAVVSAGGDLERELAAAGATDIRLPLETRSLAAVWMNARRLLRILRRQRVALLHAIGPLATASGLLAARRARVRVVATLTELPEEGGGMLRRRLLRAVARADRLLAPSAYARREAERVWALPAERLRALPPGIDLALFDPARITGHRILALAERWHIPPDRRVVMLPAPLAEGYGHERLLRAAAALRRSDFDLLFVGPDAGDERFARRLEALLRETGLGERVRFAADCEDMPAAYRLADLVVLPADRPLLACPPLLEAQAMGRPVVVGRAGCLPEMLLPMETGMVLESGDPAELARAVDLVLDTAEPERLRAGEQARRFVAARFGLEEAIEATLDLYRELLGVDTVRRPPVEPVAARRVAGDA